MDLRKTLAPHTHRDEETWVRALDAIRSAEVAVFPTETVYGLGADARSDEACRKIFAIKSRAAVNPLIVHLSSVEKIEEIAYLSPLMRKLAVTFSPGPFTLILPFRKGICATARAGQNTVAVRIPAHPLAAGFLKELDFPVAAPSVNLSGRPSATSYVMVREAVSDDVPVIDGGSCQWGLESTIVKEEEHEICILRPGSITIDQIRACTQGDVHHARAQHPTPGSTYAHYRPLSPLYLFEGPAALKYPEAGLLILSKTLVRCPNPPQVRMLQQFDSETDYAHHLYRCLHRFSDCCCILAELPPGFTALRDRLLRAASDRIENLRKEPL